METKQDVRGKCGNCGVSPGEENPPLSVCSACKTRKYCSAECQQQHWPLHKIFCKPNDNTVYHNIPPEAHLAIAAVNIRPIISPDAYKIAYDALPDGIPPSLQLSSWVELPLARTLGIPISMTVVGDAIPDNPKVPNVPVNAMGIDPDPISKSFGQAIWQPQTAPIGQVLLKRQDGKKLHMAHVRALALYAEKGLKAVRNVKNKEAKAETVDRQVLASRFLTPEAFQKFMEEMRFSEGDEQQKLWEHADSVTGTWAGGLPAG